MCRMSDKIDDGLNDHQMRSGNKLSSFRYRAYPPRIINMLLIIILVTPFLSVHHGRSSLLSGTVRPI